VEETFLYPKQFGCQEILLKFSFVKGANFHPSHGGNKRVQSDASQKTSERGFQQIFFD